MKAGTANGDRISCGKAGDFHIFDTQYRVVDNDIVHVVHRARIGNDCPIRCQSAGRQLKSVAITVRIVPVGFLGTLSGREIRTTNLLPDLNVTGADNEEVHPAFAGLKPVVAHGILIFVR